MTIQLVPMTEADFAGYCERLAVAYAQEQVASGEWDQASAVQQAQASLARLLPNGLATPDNFLYFLYAEAASVPVGQLWVAVSSGADPSAFILDIEINAPYQRRGYGQQALQALEALLRPMGIRKIGLHVHAQNHGAHALYAKMGYAVTGFDMLKQLDADS